MRLSVTEVCNFRCTYCLRDGYRKSGPMDFLRPGEVDRLVRAFAQLGISKVRLTGGEPTVRKDVTQLIARVSAQPGIDKIALTTNGWNLARNVDEWVAAGLTNLNVSVDALDRDAFIVSRDTTGWGCAGGHRARHGPAAHGGEIKCGPPARRAGG
ncbi:radical SAM protein [Hankyongella ginsenosidimutans]|uniref:radical SAM protein n=1 Tax=Hankyongella ginsenosidimutans TaxID=1763828 RepID=UPI001FEC4B9B|nr:radical SAM protein [Hankyongella ginsenosidimutans]